MMSSPNLSAPVASKDAALRTYLDHIRREILNAQCALSGIRRLLEAAPESHHDELPGFHAELSTLLDLLNDRLAGQARALTWELVCHRCLALAELEEIRQSEEGGAADE